MQNKSFDYWRSEKNHFTESCTLNLEISESSDGFIDNMINKIYLDELFDRLLTKTEHEIINQLILKDKKSSVVSKELNKSVSAINKSKQNALKKLLKFIQEGGQIYGN